MKIYIAGKITNNPNFEKDFEKVEIELLKQGYTVLNPAKLPRGLYYEDYMHICFAMIDISDAVCLMGRWKDSEGVKRERVHAIKNEKAIWEELY